MFATLMPMAIWVPRSWGLGRHRRGRCRETDRPLVGRRRGGKGGGGGRGLEKAGEGGGRLGMGSRGPEVGVAEGRVGEVERLAGLVGGELGERRRDLAHLRATERERERDDRGE